MDLIVHMGDQIYGDDPPDGASGDMPHDERYRHHYVNTWSHPDVRAVLASCPSVMTWDDHEIWDGYGSNKRDWTKKARRRFEAAKTAFVEFQMALAPAPFAAPSFAWLHETGGVAILAPDGRQHRDWEKRTILGETQLRSIIQKLDELAKRPKKPLHLFVVLGTPPYHLKTWVVSALDKVSDNVRDGWTAENNIEELKKLMEKLARFSTVAGVPVTILGGDVHVSTVGTIRVPDQGSTCLINQITSSGIGRSAASNALEYLLAAMMNKGRPDGVVDGKITASLRRIDDERSPYVLTDRNFAVVEARANEPLRVTYHRERHKDAEREFDRDFEGDERTFIDAIEVSLAAPLTPDDA